MKTQSVVSWLVQYKGVTFDTVEEDGETLVNVENAEGVFLTIEDTRNLILSALVHLGPWRDGPTPTECAALDLCKMHMDDLQRTRYDLNKLHGELREAHKEIAVLRAELVAARQHAE